LGGEFVREPFLRPHGIRYSVCEQPKSDLYRDLLPAFNSGKVDLLDNPRLVAQLCALERKTARSGRDSIDHLPGGHDDLCNCVAGAIALANSGVGPLVISPAVLARAKMPDRRMVLRRLAIGGR
jgi:hypothetical protein